MHVHLGSLSACVIYNDGSKVCVLCVIAHSER